MKYYTVQETANIFRCSTDTIKRRIDGGIIPTHPDDKKLIPKEYVEIWDIQSNETFRERKLKQEIEQKDETITQLKTKIRQILQISLEVEK